MIKFIALLSSVIFSAIFTVWFWNSIPNSSKSEHNYIDSIVLPVEAFGAHWRIKNFRKNVPFPNGFEEAFKRATKAALLFSGRDITISIAPRVYKIKKPIFIPANITIDLGQSIIRLIK